MKLTKRIPNFLQLTAYLGVAVTSREAAEDYARNDPFVRAGEVASWTIREWANIFGSGDVQEPGAAAVRLLDLAQ